MEAIKEFVGSCSDWLLGSIQTQLIKIAFPIVLGFQIGNWLHIAPIFSVYSEAMDRVWWVDLVFSGVALVNYACRKPEEFLEQVRKYFGRFVAH